VEILDGAVIVGPASIGADSVVGAGTLISRSVIWSGCTIGPNATVDRSILSSGVIVAPGARLFGTVEVSPRPAVRKRVRRSVPVPHAEPAVSTQGLAFR
jgi:NDP-sugar pyrophosphorylase family protein